ncbi:UV DNA damage repair endonuclease UvsE [Rubrivirga sp.]|uniref:UV DNA damage repair endonuclease UvsE n=1 Tax=Rubrivirga sp. TaxID=1885344 RepID=UPI003B52BB49
MRLRHLGYACLNTTLGTQSRTVRLANLRTETVIPVVVQNLGDVLAALRWNVAHDLRFFRVSSDLIPFGPLDVFPFDWAEAFDWQFREIRRLVKAEGLRVTSHPGQYTVLNSPRPEVVTASVEELDFQARVLKLMGGDTMTLHVGGAYGDKPAALDRFAQNLGRLSDDARARLAIENDDTTYTLAETVGLAERTGLPVIVDLFHHVLNPSGETADEGLLDLLDRAQATWGKRVPKLHLSSHKPGTRTGHADFLDMDDVDRLVGLMEQVGPPDAPYDLMLEAKAKERAVLEVRHYLETGERPDRPIPMETVAEAG